MGPHGRTGNATRVVRLWWRCTVCGRRFDLFGVDHADSGDRRAAAYEALDHLDGHGLHLGDLARAASHIEPAGRTSRVRRHELLRPLSSPRAATSRQTSRSAPGPQSTGIAATAQQPRRRAA